MVMGLTDWSYSGFTRCLKSRSQGQGEMQKTQAGSSKLLEILCILAVGILIVCGIHQMLLFCVFIFFYLLIPIYLHIVHLKRVSFQTQVLRIMIKENCDYKKRLKDARPKGKHLEHCIA